MEKVVCMVHSKQDASQELDLNCKCCRSIFVSNVLVAQSKRASVVAAWLENKSRRETKKVPQYAASV